MKNILVLTDFSTSAFTATNYALKLFEHKECTFYFLNTYTPEIINSRYMADPVSIDVKNATAAQASKNGLDGLVRKINKNGESPLHNYKTISSFSLLIDAVKHTVIDLDVGYIIMGATGCSENASIYMGSNAVRIVHSVLNCSVVVVPKEFQLKLPKIITFIANFNQVFASRALDPIVMLAKLSHSSIEIVNFQLTFCQLPVVQRLNHQIISEKFDAMTHSFHRIAAPTSFSESIKEFMKKSNGQLVVMSNDLHSYMNDISSKFIISRSTFTVDIPLLLIQGMGEKLAVNRSIVSETQ